MKIKLKKFDVSSIDDDKVVVLIGKRGTGKSYLVKDLLHQHRSLPIGTVISPTESANKFFGDILPKGFIHDEYTPELISNVVKRQKVVLADMEKHVKVYGSTSIDPRAFLVLDDCLFDGSWVKDKNVRLLFMNGRHYKILFVITMQYPLGIPPALRTNIDYTFILRENLVSNRRRIYENYAGMFPTFDVFCQVMDQCTENFECIVIHNNCKSNKLEDQVFWYKAEQHRPFKIGDVSLWNYCSEEAADNEEEDDGEEEYDPSRYKTKGPLVSVSKRMTMY